MFEVKVKTLDGKNVSFSVEDEITVADFKAKISSSINVEPERQRLIFSGKVLHNSRQLKSYDVADKVVHVVTSSPPSASAQGGTPTPVTSSEPRRNTNRPTVSMSTVPSNMLGDVMNNVMSGLPGDAMVHHFDVRRANNPQSSPHTESGRRVVLIRQWIRDCHSLLDRVDHPAMGNRLSADTQTAEARAASIVFPHVAGEAISVSVTASNVPRTGSQSASNRSQSQPSTSPSMATSNQSHSTTRPNTTAPNQSQVGVGSSGASGQRSRPAESVASTPPINPTVEVLHSLWAEVEALQSRLRARMEPYRAMLTNPAVGCTRHNQHLFDIISSVTHTMSHIYHAISDFNCDFRPQSNRELTAPAAPAPPPTAIIQQTIPVTIPLRATVNMSPRTTRRPVSEMTSSTASTVTSSAARSAATPRPQNADGSAASRGVYADIELDMETDSGEDISEDAGAPLPPTSSNTQPSALPPDPQRPFNISQIIQDAFSNIAGTAASISTSTSTPASSTSTAFPTGTFGQFIPPPGSATPANGPVLSSAAPRNPAADQEGVPGLPPGFPINPAQFAPRDRIDPYLSICASRHWVTSSTNTSLPNQPTGTQSRTTTRVTTSTTSRSGSVATPSSRSPAATSRANPQSGSNTSDSAANNSGSTASDGRRQSSSASQTVSVERRNFFGEINNLLTAALHHYEHSASQTRRLLPRLQDMCDRAANSHRPFTNLAELDRSVSDALAGGSVQAPSSGLLEELLDLLFKDLTISDLFSAFTSEGVGFDRLRGPLRRFARSSVLQEGPHSPENMSAAVTRLMAPLMSHMQTSLASQTDVALGTYDMLASVASYVSHWLLETLNFLIVSKEGTANYGQQLISQLHQGVDNFLRLLYELYGNASPELRLSSINQTIARFVEYCAGSRQWLGHALTHFAQSQLSSEGFMERISAIPLSAVTSHLVRRGLMQTDSSAASNNFTTAQEAMPTAPTTNRNTTPAPRLSPSPLSPISQSTLAEASAADWRTVIPADWISIIEEDVKRQLRLEASMEELPPLSDEYLAGRPQKRRRLSEGEEQD